MELEPLWNHFRSVVTSRWAHFEIVWGGGRVGINLEMCKQTFNKDSP